MCLIGVLPPVVVGIGKVPSHSKGYTSLGRRTLASTLAVASGRFTSERLTKESDPFMDFLPDWPLANGPVPTPLPLVTTRVSPETATAVGYQPTGMAPLGSSVAASSTDTALSAARITYRSSPFSAKLVGLLAGSGVPSAAAKLGSPTAWVSTTSWLVVSTVITASASDTETKTSEPSAALARLDGLPPTSSFFFTSPVVGSTTIKKRSPKPVT